MNRRVFLQSAAAVPLFGVGTHSEVQANLLVDQDILVHIIATAHPGELLAERYRQEWMGEPFETRGEWYKMSTETRVLPDHLVKMPGTQTFHTASFGEAGEHQEYLVGAFRRNNISIIVRIREDNEPLMILIAEHILAQDLPGTFETLWNPSQLNNFIPTSDSLELPIEPATTFWP